MPEYSIDLSDLFTWEMAASAVLKAQMFIFLKEPAD